VTPSASFGVRVPCAGALASPASMLRTARTAERLGYHSVWVHDYVIWNKMLDGIHISCGSREAFEAAGTDYPPIFMESITNLAYLAAGTEQIKLGIGVLCLPYRAPVVTAKQLANVDYLSDGRLILGAGQGAAASTHNVDFEVLGISRATKVSRTREYLDAMLKIWHEDSPSFSGRFVNYEGATIYPKPVQKPHPEIWIGGQADKSLQMVADYADGWLSFWITPTQFAAALPKVHGFLERAGRDPASLQIGTEIQVYLADSTDRARREATPTVAVFEEGYAGTTGTFAEPDASGLDQIWNSSLIGSADEVRDEVQRYLDAGCTFFELKFIYRDVDHLEAQLETFATEVIAKVDAEIR
jgi:probable F420-dependent oxidoreductase